MLARAASRRFTAAPGGFVRMLGGWTRGIYEWVLHWADTPYALAALCLLSFTEAAFFPIPPDVLLIAMCLGATKRGFVFAGACSVASVLGGLLGYGIGAFAWGAVDHIFYAYVPGFSPARFQQVQELYRHWGIAIVFTAGFSPIPYKIFTVASGVMDMALGPFILASALSRSARFFLLAALIYRYGARVKQLIDRYFNWLALAFCLALVGGFAILKVWLGP